MSKTQKVKNYLLDGHKITQMKAIELFNAYRLSGIIWRLKNDGYQIENIVTYDKKTGRKNNFATYKLISKPLEVSA